VGAVLIEGTADPSLPFRAYAGIEIAAHPAWPHEFGELDETQRNARVLESQTAWLAGQLAGHLPVAFDVRWLSDPVGQRLRLSVLARVDAADHSSAVSGAEEAIRRLSAMPPYVRATRIINRANLGAALNPFRPHERGMVEIRKHCVVGRPNRPDAGVQLYLAIRPFTMNASPWTEMLAVMADHSAPLVLSIGLMPMAVSSSFARVLEVSTANYARLAREGEWRSSGALYLSSLRLAPEPFAMEAEQLFLDAWHRYRDRVFRIRVQLCSPEPIEDDLAIRIGNTISPVDPVPKNQLTGNRIGLAYRLERPFTPADRHTYLTNLVCLTHGDWGGDPRVWGVTPDQRVPAPLRELCYVVDAAQAAAAVRLPIVPFGERAKIFISYRRSDSSGYVNGLCDRLSAHFGRDSVIRDLVSIPAGADFPRFIAETVASSDVFIAVIGRTWATCEDDSGKRRLDQPGDYVRLEVQQALQQQIPVLPVLVQNASMPSLDSLPGCLASLCTKNAFEISDSRWDYDVDRLVASVDELLGKQA
jgi:hypothetical protein